MEEGRKYGEISVQELRRRMDGGEAPVVLDVMLQEVFEKKRIPGAKNACVFQVIFPAEAEAAAPDKDREIVVYDLGKGSHEALVAADKLTRLGYRKALILSGGFAAWREAGYPVEGADPDCPDEGPRLVIEDRTYIVDAESSFIGWTGRNPNVKHWGTLRLLRGEISFQNGNGRGVFEIDMDSIKNASLEGSEWQPVLISHLKSDDFFFVEKFPKAVFSIEAARPLDGGRLISPNFRIQGALELRGVSGGIEFPATLSNLPDGAIGAEAHFDFDRTLWRVIYGSRRFFEHLGMHLVFEPISVEVRIVAR